MTTNKPLQATDTLHLRIADYDYPLPSGRIAKFPLPQRDGSKLLVYDHGKISEDIFRHLPAYIPQGTLMVFNNTKVIQARIHFRKSTGALIEVFLLEPLVPADYERVFQATGCCSWLCMIGNKKKWKDGVLVRGMQIKGMATEITAAMDSGWKAAHPQSQYDKIDFSWRQHASAKRSASESHASLLDDGRAQPALCNDGTAGAESGNGQPCFADILDSVGELPIPPYLERETQESDKTTYQTVYSKIKGSVAAPTAGLHFTDEVLSELVNSRGVDREELTLHVGAGTFKPVKSQYICGHVMHTEYICVRRQTIEKLIKHGGKATAVGTTSVRTLESLYYMGLRVAAASHDISEDELHIPQWEPYGEPTLSQSSMPATEALGHLLAYMRRRQMDALHTSTQIIIAPGYEYKIVNRLITNFHQPQSTLLLLVSAFVKGDWRSIYDYALSHDFRFLSYGDSSLLIP